MASCQGGCNDSCSRHIYTHGNWQVGGYRRVNRCGHRTHNFVICASLADSIAIRDQAAHIHLEVADDEHGELAVTVYNNSKMPISGLRGKIQSNTRSLLTIYPLSQLSHSEFLLQFEDSRVEPDGKTRAQPQGLARSAWTAAHIVFQDAFGREWGRDWPTGELHDRQRSARVTCYWCLLVEGIYFYAVIVAIYR